MNEFVNDDAWQKEIRDRILKPFYEKYSFESRFVFADKGKLATTLQREIAVDTVVQKKENELAGIEEKIVRWPGYSYTAFTFEIFQLAHWSLLYSLVPILSYWSPAQ